MRLLVLATVMSLAPAVSTAQAVYGGGFPEEKKSGFQITGGMMIPFLNYSNRVDDIGWNTNSYAQPARLDPFYAELQAAAK